MEVGILSANIRQKAGKGSSHAARRQHKIPGVLYGKGMANTLVEFSDMELNNVLQSKGEHGVVNVNINGSNIKAMIKEVQKDPVNRKPIHIDMKYIKADEKIHADIPIVIKGEDKISSQGAIIQKQISTVTVEGKPDNIPKYLSLDASNLGIGSKLTVADIEFSSDLSILTDMNAVIAIVSAPDKQEDEKKSEE